MQNISGKLTTFQFKNAATKAVLSILLFIGAYIVLFLLACAFAVLCGFLGISLIALKPNIFTLGIGIGFIGLGIIVFIFLVKFLFKRNKIDRSNLIEIGEDDAPPLYAEIRELVREVKTQFPKKIYLTNEVNAFVFYDSTFLSMVFPVKKNLVIGMGLVNSVTKEELKVILAHEFGHFSQRSMKVGSYVYTVNQIIYNMLYENEGYHNVVSSFANFSSYFSFFAIIGYKIVQGIQWLLQKLYNVVNIQHLKLSREMEFHADAIAVSTVGSKPFINSMMRLDIANNAYDKAINYYEQKIEENIKPNNIYPQQYFVMQTLAMEDGLDIANGFPIVTSEFLHRYNKSKLVIKNQWASHPSLEDRIQAVSKGGYKDGNETGEPASGLFANLEELQENLTALLFSKVEYKEEPSFDNIAAFKDSFAKSDIIIRFPKMFNSYYDYYNPSKLVEEESLKITQKSSEKLFSNQIVDLLYYSKSLEADISTLEEIYSNSEYQIKTFEYDGVKYNKNEIAELLPKLKDELKVTDSQITANDNDIYQYFKSISGSDLGYVLCYKRFSDFDEEYDALIQVFTDAYNQLQFINYTTPYEEIEKNLSRFEETEQKLREKMNYLLTIDEIERVKSETKAKLIAFLSEDRYIYFIEPVYHDNNLLLLFSALYAFRDVLGEIFLIYKKDLLNEMEKLEIRQQKVVA